MADFKNLRVWHAAQQLALDTHRVSAALHGAGAASLRDQLMRAAMSIPINIVEGTSHSSPREFLRFLSYALASASEVEGHTRLAESLSMISEKDSDCLLDGVEAVRMMLHGLIKRVKARTK